MAKLKCIAHNSRVFVNGESGSVRHRSNLENCDTANVIILDKTIPREAFIWLCDPKMPEHYTFHEAVNKAHEILV